MELNIKLEGGIIPHQNNPTDAGFDLYVPDDIYVRPYDEDNFGRQIIPLNFRLELPNGYGASIRPRSGYSSKGVEGYDGYRVEDEKRFFTLQWTDGECKEVFDTPSRYDMDVIIGLCDSGYRGIYGVIVKNYGRGFWLKKGTRIAQMVIERIENSINFIPTEELSESDRGVNAYGSSNE